MAGGELKGEGTGKYRLLALLAASVLAPMSLFALATWQGYCDARDGAQEQVARAAAILAAQTTKLFDNASLTLDLVEHQLAVISSADVSARAFHQFLRDHVSDPAPVHGLGVIAADGRLLATSRTFPAPRIDASDHEPFVAALQAEGTVVSRRVIARASGDPVFFVSRQWRIGGRTGAVLTLSFHTGYFERLFAAMVGQIDRHPAVSLVRRDGHRLVRYPAADADAGGDAGEWLEDGDVSVFEGLGMVDGVRRIYAVHEVSGYDVQVRFGRSVDSLFADWRRTMLLNGTIALLVTILLAGLSFLAMRRERAAHLLAARLDSLAAERGAEAERRAQEAEAAIIERGAALAAAERANRAKSHFLASASHDLRQPVQGVRLFLDVLDGRLDDPVDRQVLTRASQALEGAEALLSTLLDVSALEAGMVSVHLHDIPLGGVLDTLDDEFAAQAAAAGLRFRCVHTSLRGHADPVLLARLLRNLLTNAVRYTRTGKLLLGCRHAGGRLRIEVWDTGPGIPAEMLETVFDDFVQLGNPERDRAKGLGLGLAVARRMATLMGHRMGVRSRLGRGTVFWVELPAAGNAHPSLPKVRDFPTTRHIQIA